MAFLVVRVPVFEVRAIALRVVEAPALFTHLVAETAVGKALGHFLAHICRQRRAWVSSLVWHKRRNRR
jgi:hypothetical protein